MDPTSPRNSYLFLQFSVLGSQLSAISQPNAKSQPLVMLSAAVRSAKRSSPRSRSIPTAPRNRRIRSPLKIYPWNPRESVARKFLTDCSLRLRKTITLTACSLKIVNHKGHEGTRRKPNRGLAWNWWTRQDSHLHLRASIEIGSRRVPYTTGPGSLPRGLKPAIFFALTRR